MDLLGRLMLGHAGWLWMALGCVLLAAEVAFGTGWLLWAAGSAGATGLLALLLPGLGWPGEVAIFAVLTLVSSLASHRFAPRRPRLESPDINDAADRLIGARGAVVGDWRGGEGRVLVGGAEWPATLRTAEPPPPGARVRVLAISGARLLVAAEE